jgi:hypothetical protein
VTGKMVQSRGEGRRDRCATTEENGVEEEGRHVEQEVRSKGLLTRLWECWECLESGYYGTHSEREGSLGGQQLPVLVPSLGDGRRGGEGKSEGSIEREGRRGGCKDKGGAALVRREEEWI